MSLPYDFINPDARKTWAVTGAGGFIGSYLVETLIAHNQAVVGMDDFSTGARKNLESVRRANPKAFDDNFTFAEGDIRNAADCNALCKNADIILHQAAIGSVPKSFEEPVYVDSVNVGGFLNILQNAARAGAKRIVYASSSAVYGDNPHEMNTESQPLILQSPYAVGKYANENYAAVMGRHYGIETIGLRYFNVYGARQNPDGAYAGVIAQWTRALLDGNDIRINGDGETYRDFCYIDDVVQANLRAALVDDAAAIDTVYNVASGNKTSLNTLFSALKQHTGSAAQVVRGPARTADIKISCADISKAQKLLGYAPRYTLLQGLEKMLGELRAMAA